MRTLRVIIVDDEIIMCEALKREVEKYSFIEVVGLYHDGDDALQAIEQLKPNIVFLDIRMPGLNGLEVAAKIDKQENPPVVVFVSAYDDYALKGYGVNALDYILKPFDSSDIERIMHKIHRLRLLETSEITTKDTHSKSQSEFRPQKYCAYHDDIMEIISSDAIKLFFVENGHVFVLTAEDKQYSMKQTLQEIEQQVDTRQFFRCHRNYIVNVDYIKQISPWFNRGYLLTLKDKEGTEVPVSRNNVKKLKQYIYF